MELAAAAVSDVNSERDGMGLSYARKAMIRTSLACDVNGQWHVGQLAPELLEIIRLYPIHFGGVSVPILV